ncbi:MAG: MFS transporter [Ignavibacteriales bacterium]|nr:MFS transporter [Ignavibacteriales bacterium]
MLEWFFGPEVREKRGVLRQNVVANIIDGGMYAFGISFVAIQTVIPVMVKHISGSDFAVGLVPVLWAAGFNFPQIFIANHAQRFPYKMRLFLRVALVQRVPWLMLALLSFFMLGRLSPTTGTLLFFFLFTLAAITGSLCFPIWFDMIAKLTPVDLRGRLFAARNLLGGILGVFAGMVVGWALVEIEYPLSYGVLFTLAVLFMVVSYWALTRLSEEVASPVAEEVHILEYYRNLPRILKGQKNFRNFLISDALLLAATMASAFYAVHAIQKFALSDSSAGLFTVMIMFSTIVGNMFFGYIADRYGHKVNLVLAAASTALSCFAALLAPDQGLYLIVFVGLAFQIGLSGISRLSIVAELCSEEERPTYVALTNLVTSPFILFGLVAAGIAGQFGYDAVFLIAGLLAVASALWMAIRVEEPRKIVRRPIVQSAQYE